MTPICSSIVRNVANKNLYWDRKLTSWSEQHNRNRSSLDHTTSSPRFHCPISLLPHRNSKVTVRSLTWCLFKNPGHSNPGYFQWLCQLSAVTASSPGSKNNTFQVTFHLMKADLQYIYLAWCIWGAVRSLWLDDCSNLLAHRKTHTFSVMMRSTHCFPVKGRLHLSNILCFPPWNKQQFVNKWSMCWHSGYTWIMYSTSLSFH